MAQFQALQLALELASELGPVLARVQQHDRDMANQLRRATTSVPSCLSEGSQRTGKDRLQLYRTSAGSAAEVKVQLQLAVAWGYVEAERAARALELADRMVAITWRLTRPRR
jgi:four helix bundle protein